MAARGTLQRVCPLAASGTGSGGLLSMHDWSSERAVGPYPTAVTALRTGNVVQWLAVLSRTIGCSAGRGGVGCGHFRADGLSTVSVASRRAPAQPPRVGTARTTKANRIASHRIASKRIASHRIASHRSASHRIASHRIATVSTQESERKPGMDRDSCADAAAPARDRRHAV